MNLWFNQIIPYLLLVLFYLQSTPHSPVPRAHIPLETADQPPKLYRPPGAPFGPVRFTEYPPNSAYLEFTLEEILIHDPEARTRETETVYREGDKITIPPQLYQDKYNFLRAYLVPMTPPHTPRPDRLQDSVATDEYTSTQIFGVMYITLTGLIDSMVPTSGPWAILGKLLSYIVKLAPILWWALPSGPAGRQPTSSQEPPSGWIPDRFLNTAVGHRQGLLAVSADLGEPIRLGGSNKFNAQSALFDVDIVLQPITSQALQDANGPAALSNPGNLNQPIRLHAPQDAMAQRALYNPRDLAQPINSSGATCNSMHMASSEFSNLDEPITPDGAMEVDSANILINDFNLCWANHTQQCNGG
ncbi:hypothetical protein DSO57_1025440 [Entomophthora muscae]|uniref:Uncharacterized protein n=1 Tax=Entomophthora muscae TaxID=34485 RepID=A0ACC2SR96_9FUNG|nr:hypothetical protein DSO57_1025440 [Entomophthora muscae]